MVFGGLRYFDGPILITGVWSFILKVWASRTIPELIGCLHGDFRSLRDRPRVDPSVYMVIIGSAQVFESV